VQELGGIEGCIQPVPVEHLGLGQAALDQVGPQGGEASRHKPGEVASEVALAPAVAHLRWQTVGECRARERPIVGRARQNRRWNAQAKFDHRLGQQREDQVGLARPATFAAKDLAVGDRLDLQPLAGRDAGVVRIDHPAMAVRAHGLAHPLGREARRSHGGRGSAAPQRVGLSQHPPDRLPRSPRYIGEHRREERAQSLAPIEIVPDRRMRRLQEDRVASITGD